MFISVTHQTTQPPGDYSKSSVVLSMRTDSCREGETSRSTGVVGEELVASNQKQLSVIVEELNYTNTESDMSSNLCNSLHKTKTIFGSSRESQ